MRSEGFDLLRKDIKEAMAKIESVRGSGVPRKGRPISRLGALALLDRAELALAHIEASLKHVPLAGDIVIPKATPAPAPKAKGKPKAKRGTCK